MSTKTVGSKGFKVFDDLDLTKVRITGNVSVVNEAPISTTDVEKTKPVAKKKATKKQSANTAESQAEASAEAKTAQPKKEGEMEMSKEEVKPAAEETTKVTAKAETAKPAEAEVVKKEQPDPAAFFNEVKTLREEGIVVKHETDGELRQFTKGLCWGVGIAVGVTAVSLLVKAACGDGE